VAILAALVDRGAVRLKPSARQEPIADWLRSLVDTALDAPGLSDFERAEQIANALLENGSIDEVFADDNELLRIAREDPGYLRTAGVRVDEPNAESVRVLHRR
jgi:hypothetical protein